MAKRRKKTRPGENKKGGMRSVLDGLLWLGFLALAFSLGCFLNRDMDIWWHLRSGQDILQTGRVPRVDRYSFAAEGEPWINLHWLFEVAMARLYEFGGSPLLTLAAATAATVAVGIFTATQRIPGRFGWTLLCWTAPLVLMSGRFYVRPEIWSLVLLAVYMAVGREFPRRPGMIWALVPLQALWCNFQGLFVLGYVVVGAYTAELFLRAVLSRGPWPPLRFWTGLLALVFAGLINPYGFEGLTFPLVLFRRLGAEHDFYGAHIAELTSIPAFIARNGIRNPYLVLHLILLVLVSLSFLLAWARVRFSLAILLLWVGFAWLGWRATRNSGLFAAMAGCVLIQNVRLFVEDRPLRAWAPSRFLVSRVLGLGAILFGVVFVLSGAWYRLAGEGRLVGLGEHPFWHAHDAARFAAELPAVNHIVAYHEGQAALVEFYMPDDKRVWCDPRLEVVPREALEQYYRLADWMLIGDPRWRTALAALPTPIAVLLDHEGHGAAEGTLLAAPDWRCVFFGDVAGVYLPARLAEQRGLESARFGARYFHLDELVPMPPWQPGELFRAERCVEIGRATLERPAPPLATALGLLLLARAHAERAQEHGLDRFRALRVLGMAALHLGVAEAGAAGSSGSLDPVRLRWLVVARRELNQARAMRPDDFVTAVYLFQATRLLGDRASAVRLARQVLATGPRSAQQAALLPGLRQQAEQLVREVETTGRKPTGPPRSLEQLRATVDSLAKMGDYERALEVIRSFASDGDDGGWQQLPWELADRFASLALVRTDVRLARQIWAAQVGKVPTATLAARLATTWFVEGDYAAAAERFHEGVEPGPPDRECVLGELWCSVLLRDLQRASQAVELYEAARNDGEGPRQVARALSQLVREAIQSPP